jgi:hypothetical protein
MTTLEDIFIDLNKYLVNIIIKKYDDMIFVTKQEINFEIYDYTTIKAYSLDKNYNTDIIELFKNIPQDIPHEQIPKYIIITLCADIYNTAGFEEETEDNINISKKAPIDTFWIDICKNINTQRQLTIVSFGNKYSGFDALCKTFDKTFSALHVNSKIPKGADLRYVRGTNNKIQRAVRSGSGFEFLITAIVNTIEKNNYNNIGIFCRAGHHRSVACVELLKTHIYKNAIVKHIHIK